MTTTALISHGDRDEVKRRAEPDFLRIFDEHGGQRRGKTLFCPFHQNKNTPAASIHNGYFHCFGCGLNIDVIEFIQRVKGVGFKAALQWLAERYGIYFADVLANEQRQPVQEKARIVATYDYADEHGDLLYQVVRYEPKAFRQRRPDGQDGWIWKKCEQQVLYHLSEVLEAPIVFVVEGEKDVESLRAHGFVATTNAGGAKAPWLPAFTHALQGREVILIPDADEPGRRRVLTIARALIGHAAKILILELQGAKDAAEWLETHSELELMAEVEGVTQ